MCRARPIGSRPPRYGSGTLQLQDLIAAEATAAVSGSGLIGLYASQELHVSISCTGTISYSGDPKRVTQSVTGTGAITEQ